MLIYISRVYTKNKIHYGLWIGKTPIKVRKSVKIFVFAGV